MRKCSYKKSHCRRIRSGRKATIPCTREASPGTRVKGFFTPKDCGVDRVKRIQAIVRARSARKHTARLKASRKRKGTPYPYSNKRPRLETRKRTRTSSRTPKKRTRLIEVMQ